MFFQGICAFHWQVEEDIYSSLIISAMPRGSWTEFDRDQSHPKLTKSLNVLNPLQNKDVRVQKIKSGKKGKIVTIISGLDLNSLEVKKLLKTIKANCATGGTIKNDAIEIQGDHVDGVLDFLRKKGYSAKKSGG